jgi:hypothetical protein
MDKRLMEHKHMLQSFLLEKDLNFLQENCAASIQELMQLVIFFDLPLKFLSEPLSLDNVNLVQFMFELKKRQNFESLPTSFVLSLWNLLRK